MNLRLTVGNHCWRPLTLVAAAVLLGGGPAVAADAKTARPKHAPAATAPTAATAATFDSFRIIDERNIFNPNRIGRSRSSADAPQVHADTISLVGTMRYEKGLFAFFDSPDANYRKALHEGETIAQYTVKRITPDGVELTRDKNQLSLKITDQLRRPDGSDWTLVAGGAARSDAPAADSANAADAGPPVPLAIPADASDTLKRLMAQRQKQLNQ